MTNKLKIGLIVDGTSASKYVHDLAIWAKSQDDLAISHLIVQKRSVSPELIGGVLTLLSQHTLLGLVQLIPLLMIVRFESMLLRFSRYNRDHLKKFDLSGVVTRSIEVTPSFSRSGRVCRYTAQDLQIIRDHGFDILIRCAPAILRGDILNVSRHGILSFHHGDNRINRGGPAGFWEVFLEQQTSGFIIQQLTEELDGGNVLFRGAIRTKFFYLLNQAALCEKSNHYLKWLLKKIARSRDLPAAEPPCIYFNPLYRRPGLRVQAKYLTRFALRASAELINTYILGRHERWGVAFSRCDWKSLVMWRVDRIENPSNHFLADPFVTHWEGADYCFVEDFDFSKAKACISAYRLTTTGAERLGEALTEPFHLSFPFLFRYCDKLYMCPEASESREIRIYECTEFPLNWKLVKVVMRDVSAVDTLIFEHDGRWWLFTTIDPINQRDHSSELFIFHADSPLSEAWIPHANNPIYVDANRARNAGMVLEQGGIYRMSQTPGFTTYGKGFEVNRIVKLTAADYIEERVCAIAPNFFKKLLGTHHLHSNGRVCVFDYVRRTRVN